MLIYKHMGKKLLHLARLNVLLFNQKARFFSVIFAFAICAFCGFQHVSAMGCGAGCKSERQEFTAEITVNLNGAQQTVSGRGNFEVPVPTGTGFYNFSFSINIKPSGSGGGSSSFTITTTDHNVDRNLFPLSGITPGATPLGGDTSTYQKIVTGNAGSGGNFNSFSKPVNPVLQGLPDKGYINGTPTSVAKRSSGYLYPGQSAKHCVSVDYVSAINYERHEDRWTTSHYDEKGNSITEEHCECVEANPVEEKATLSFCQTFSHPVTPSVIPGGPPIDVNHPENSGRVGISKNGGSFKYTAWDRSSEVSAWYKPSDVFRFHHQLTAGGQLGREVYGGANDQDVTIFAQSSKGGHGYLFGDDFSDKNSYNGSDFDFSDNVIAKEADVWRYHWNAYNLKWQFEFYSPGKNAKDKYRCDGFGVGKTAFQNNYYQIPASLDGDPNCKAQNYTKFSDAGSVVTQGVRFHSFGLSGKSIQDKGERVMQAHAKIPYNYFVSPYVSKANSLHHLDPSYTFSVSAYTPVIQRENKQVGDTYATITKPTTIKALSFVVDENTTPRAESVNVDDPSGNTAINNLCNAVSGTTNNTHCTDITASNSEYEGNKNQNIEMNQIPFYELRGNKDRQNIGLASGGAGVGNFSTTVPTQNISVGSRICISLAVWPSDSHNTGDASVVDSEDQATALASAGGAGAKWRVSTPVCVSVSKHPNMSVESGDLSVGGSVRTSNTRFNNNFFGSWAEHGLLAGGRVSNMASGAATAYLDPQDGSRDLNQSINGLSPWDRAGGSSNRPYSTNLCLYHTQTFVNATCKNSDIVGNLGNLATDAAQAFVRRITDMYTVSELKKEPDYDPKNGSSSLNLDNVSEIFGQSPLFKVGDQKFFNARVVGHNEWNCAYSKQDGLFHLNPNQNEVTLKNGSKTAAYYCMNNGVRYSRIDGDAVMQEGIARFGTTGAEFSSQPTHTSQLDVIDVRGTLILNGNIDYYKHAGDGYQDKFKNVSDIPRLVIFADDLLITGEVSYIDATIIVGSTHDFYKNSSSPAASYNGSGIINTCAFTDEAAVRANQYLPAAGLGGKLNASACSRELIFNGPVFAKGFIFNRTGGGASPALRANENYFDHKFLQLTGTSLPQRAEIFNLRPDAYLWGYYESERASVVTSVFARELPTRY